MIGVLLTTFAMALANLVWEYVASSHNYVGALYITWMQFTALVAHHVYNVLNKEY